MSARLVPDCPSTHCPLYMDWTPPTDNAIMCSRWFSFVPANYVHGGILFKGLLWAETAIFPFLQSFPRLRSLDVLRLNCEPQVRLSTALHRERVRQLGSNREARNKPGRQAKATKYDVYT